MIETIIGEAIAGLTTIITGSLYFANQIHKREVIKDTPKPRHIILKVPTKPEPPKPIEKDPIIAVLEDEMAFCKHRIKNASNLSKDAGLHYRTRIKEITNELVKIYSEKSKNET